jgi:Ca-activated chloride channel family protein
MPPLSIELVPSRPAVRVDAPVTLDLLLRITASAPEGVATRPALNLALVLDRSGSMNGDKISHARQAAAFAVQQLLPTDRVSVTIFDDHVETIVPSTPAEARQAIIALINTVQPRGSTALHAGWTEGARQVRQHLTAAGLNRVLLLTDGLANVGETDPAVITADVKRLAAEGVSTTTMGVGRDYNEKLLEAMALGGDGNYYFIESAVQLADIFQTELHGLMATVGHAFKLGIEPLGGATLTDVLNDLERDVEGQLVLPNLVVGLPVDVVLRLNVPAQACPEHLCRFHLSWIDPREGRKQQSALLTLPPVDAASWQAMTANAAVREQAALQMAGRAKREVTRFLDERNLTEAREWLTSARSELSGLPQTSVLAQEERDLGRLEERIQTGDLAGAAKDGREQHYRRRHSKQPPPPQGSTE